MFAGYASLPFIKYLIHGIKSSPAERISIPIIKYTFFRNLTMAQTVSESPWAIGEYIAYTTALLNPSSERFYTCKIEEKRLSSPKESALSFRKKTIRRTNGKTNNIILLVQLHKILFLAFSALFNLIIFSMKEHPFSNIPCRTHIPH